MSLPAAEHSLTIEHHGKERVGFWSEQGGLITVEHGLRTVQATPLRFENPVQAAERMLREILETEDREAGRHT